MKKIILLVLVIPLLIGCSCNKKEEEKITKYEDMNYNIREKLNGVESVVLDKEYERIEMDDNKSPFTVSGYSLAVNPSYTYETAPNVGNPETFANLSVLYEIGVSLKYDKEAYKEIVPLKVSLNEVKLDIVPNLGVSKLHEITSYNSETYIDDLIKTPLEGKVVYKKDVLDIELKDGNQSVLFANRISNLAVLEVSKIQNKDFVEVLKDQKITYSDIGFKVSFVLEIYTKDTLYALPFEIDTTGFDFMKDKDSLVENHSFINPLYFVKTDL